MRLIVVGFLAAALSSAALNHIYIDQRQDVQGAKQFGSAGPYERIAAKAMYDSPASIPMEFLKPRDPSKGNGALVVMTDGKSGLPEALMQRGYTVLRLKTADPAAVREMVSFLRYGGGPDAFLLGDQKRFLKRAILVGEAPVAQAILATNANDKSKRLIDAVVISGAKPYQAAEGVKVAHAKIDLSAAVLEIDGQLSPAAP